MQAFAEFTRELLIVNDAEGNPAVAVAGSRLHEKS